MDKKAIGIELIKKLTKDKSLRFNAVTEHFKHGSNVKTFNKTSSGTYDKYFTVKMKQKDKEIFSKYFKKFEFLGIFAGEGSIGLDGYSWDIDYDSIKIKEAKEYLNSEMINNFEKRVKYQLLEDYVYDEYKAIQKGAVFEVINIGSSSDNQTELKIEIGYFKLNKDAPINEYNAEKKEHIFSYDPYSVLMPKVKKYIG